MVVGAGATAVLLVVSEWSSAERRGLRDLWRSVQPATGIALIQGRLVFGLILLGIVAGIPIALGLFPGNVLTLIGALVACMLGRGLASGDKSFLSRTGPPFLILSWSIIAALGRFQTLDLGAAMGAQSVLGFGPEDTGVWTASWAAGILGLVGAAAWAASLPAISGFERASSLDRLLRIGESALAATAVSATVWGPSLGALVRGPLDERAVALTALSFGVTSASVALTARLRVLSELLLRPVVVATLAALSLATLVAIELAT